MAKMIMAPVVATTGGNTVAVRNETKEALYNFTGGALADKFNTTVTRVKPTKVDGKKTGDYGLFIEIDGAPFLVQIVAKKAATLADFAVDQHVFEPGEAEETEGDDE
jgi:hypothetical protein